MSFDSEMKIKVKGAELTYLLQAVVVHRGEFMSGHYYSFIKSFDDNQWRIFDDKNVRRVSSTTISFNFVYYKHSSQYTRITYKFCTRNIYNFSAWNYYSFVRL